MADQSISCPSCGLKIPLTRALRAEIEGSLRQQYDAAVAAREQELRASFERERAAERERLEREAALRAQAQHAEELRALRDALAGQSRELEQARQVELALRRRERELERRQQDLELTVARKVDEERARIAADARERLDEEHRLRDAEKDRQLAEMRRQIDDLRRRAEQGSQQLQGEAGEDNLEGALRAAFPWDDISGIGQGVRGADIRQVVIDPRGLRCGVILWECKTARHWSDGWIAKLKEDQRACAADAAVLVTATLPRGCTRFTMVDGVLVTDFACAAALAAVLRVQLVAVAQARSAASTKGEKLELLHRYLSGVAFRQRVEAIVEAFARMREDLDAERRAAERQWARRARQLEAVTLNMAGMYGDLQGLIPALPSIPQLELPGHGGEAAGLLEPAPLRRLTG